jgi:hypothetical protein
MFSAMLLAISVVAMFQFALFYWRAVLTGVATRPISERVLDAVQVAETDLQGADFERLARLHELTPELNADKSGLRFVSVYYNLVSKTEELFGNLSPVVLNWGERERVLCARYAAVQISHRLQANLAEAASMRSC